MQGPVATLTAADPEMPRAGHSPGLGEQGWEDRVCHPGQMVGSTPTLQLLVLELPLQTLETENSTTFEVWQESPRPASPLLLCFCTGGLLENRGWRK